MALALTDRGVVQTTSGLSGTTFAVSGSFSPTGGALLVVVAYLIQDGTAAPTMSLSDTFSGTGTWVEQTTATTTDGSTFGLRMSAWTAVLGGTPGTGAVTITRNTAGSVDQWIIGDIAEITGQHATFLGAKGAAAYNTSSSTFTVTLSGAPASTSLVIGAIANNSGPPTAITQPSGWTELQDVAGPNVGNEYESAYINGSSVTAPQWSGLVAGVFGRAGAAVEIIPAAGAFDPTTIQPRWDYSHSALRR